MTEPKDLFAWDVWANRAVLENLRALATPPPRAAAILNHIIGTEWLWLARVRNVPSAVAVWPSFPFDEASSQLDEVTRAWRDLVYDDAQLVTYTNSLGETYTNRAADIVTHLIMHGTYHRGQIATIVREAGKAPAYTDYIHYVRSVR